MKRSLLRRGMAGLATLGVAAAAFLAATPHAAHAGPTRVITATGSDTTQDFMDVILNGTGNNYNLHALILPNPGGTQTIPGDADCASKTYTSDPGLVPPDILAPNGSGAGADALKTMETAGAGANGCYDIARSSNAPRAVGAGSGKDSTNMRYYAYALDAVGWASPSLQAPANLTLAQLKSIYNCTFTDWSQVGGGAGPIQRYTPQTGSGTYKFFVGPSVLNFDPHSFSGAGCPAVIDTQLDNGGLPLEENHGDMVDLAGYQKAILPYSAGQWAFQANLSINPTLDHRNGTREGNMIGVRTEPTVSTTNASATITGPAVGTFFGLDTGAAITGPGIAANTTVVSVAANGLTATLSQAATATGSGSMVLTDLGVNPVGWNASGGLFQPNSPTVANPRGPITENFVLLNDASTPYPGVRYLWNITDQLTPLPARQEARDLVAFDNVGAGAKSQLCSNANFSDILAFGFAPLPSTNGSLVNPSHNLAGANCREWIPS